MSLLEREKNGEIKLVENLGLRNARQLSVWRERHQRRRRRRWFRRRRRRRRVDRSELDERLLDPQR